jgi:hypothetical protein
VANSEGLLQMTPIQKAAETEHMISVLLRWVPPEYRYMVHELAKRDPKAPAEIVSSVWDDYHEPTQYP